MTKGIKVIKDKCKGCNLCVKACGYDAIVIKDKLAIIDENKCTYCSACVEACKFNAIEMVVEATDHEKYKDYSGVWVYGENRDGHLVEVVYELVGEGRKLADKLKQELAVILIGDKTKQFSDELFAYGVDKVYYIEDKLLKDYETNTYTKVLQEAIKQYTPDIVLFGATSEGRSIAPRIAARIQTGLTADCTSLDISEDDDLAQTRPAFGGNIMATIFCNRRPQMATVRPHVMEKAKKVKTKSKGEVIKLTTSVKPDEQMTKVVDFVKEVQSNVNLAEADIIVSAGRGIQNQDNLYLIHGLAKAIGGLIGASRAVVDAGWIEHFHQVGQTGKTVHPKVYIACGISGAIQHLAGMSSSDFIIAINKDADAPIFNIADVGIVGDLFKVIPALIKELKR